jgi:hypothetical protein
MRLHQRCRTAVAVAGCLLVSLLVNLLVLPADSRPLPHTQVPRAVEPTAGADWVGGVGLHGALAGAAGDTVTLLGGPDRLDGRFEDETGLPAWHGWTSRDYTAAADTFWSISTFNAEALGGHGPGNHAIWCGTEFPDGAIGYGNYWRQHLGWSWPVADPGEPVTVQLTARMNHDTEPGFDMIHLQVWRLGGWQVIATWTGYRIDRAIDEVFTVWPEDLAGPAGDEIRLRFSFISDETWSDEDGLYPTDGACQIDDIGVLVDGVEVTFDDFEPDSPVSWTPRFYDGVGDYAQLVQGLADRDPCRSNSSVQVVFIDDGLVVPGTGGSPCITWCYGPGGWVVNSYGGLIGAGGYLDNGLVSPPLAWPEGTDDLLLEFDAYVHEPLTPQSPGIVYRWRVRSTDQPQPEALEEAEWRQRDVVYAGGPAYRRHQEPAGDLLVPDRQWVQIELQVMDFRGIWERDGHDASPAPYFDNVAVKAFPAAGPRIVVDDLHLPQDTFPESGVLDLVDLERNSCRFDMAANIRPPGSLANVAGDSMVVAVHLLRPDEELVEPPRLRVRLRANPFFDAVRIMQPDSEGFLDLTAVGEPCQAESGQIVPDRWAFDLPDTGLIYPGDVLHFYVEARGLAAGVEMLATWPADTTGWTDFAPDSIWPHTARMRALPTVVAADGTQPPLLVWRDDPLPAGGHEPWQQPLALLGLEPGIDYDLFRTRSPLDGAGNGLGGRATVAQLAGYRTLLYDCGRVTRHTLADGTRGDPSQDVQLVRGWLDTGGRQAFFTGDNLASDLTGGGPASQVFLSQYLGLLVQAADGAALLGGQSSPRAAVLPGGGVFQSLQGWQVEGGCPEPRRLDVVIASTQAQPLAHYLAPGGGGAYPYAAATRRLATFPERDVISLPVSFAAIVTDGGVALDQSLSARTMLLADVLLAFGQPLAPTSAGPAAGRLLARGHPNPFNPRTTISYEIPAAGHVRLEIHDLRGRLVRTLLDGWQPAGSGVVVWDGRDARGRACASGVYVHSLQAGGATHLGKILLVR